MNLRQPLASAYRGDIRLGLTVVVLFLIVSSMVTDGGQLFQLIGATSLVYCLGLTVIVCRRPKSPTKTDLWLVRFGFFILLVLVPACLFIGWWMRGIL